jgi:hypothetical protein
METGKHFEKKSMRVSCSYILIANLSIMLLQFYSSMDDQGRKLLRAKQRDDFAAVWHVRRSFYWLCWIYNWRSRNASHSFPLGAVLLNVPREENKRKDRWEREEATATRPRIRLSMTWWDVCDVHGLWPNVHVSVAERVMSLCLITHNRLKNNKRVNFFFTR